ncbi:MAG: hypothetical protein JW839_07415 [Candidatus Lokiarchaeota archaeon]|nr:hypothetical protein [Candidatus Lokiarchaeota archaeon]
MADNRCESMGAEKLAAQRDAYVGKNSAGKVERGDLEQGSELSRAEIAIKFMGCLRSSMPHVKPVPFAYVRSDGHAGVLVEICNGQPRVPRPGKEDYEITILDLLESCIFFDIPVLLEGATGVGKTFLLTQMFNTLFGSTGYYYVRLERSLTGRSVMDPFLTRTLVKKLPMTSIDKPRCSHYAGIFIDEPNRGDSQDTLQILDSKISLYGEDAELGMPIPGTGRLKPPFIAAAMNPNDARYAATEPVDGAVESRLLRITYPATRGKRSGGKCKAPEGCHELFWADFRRETGLAGAWRDLYPAVTDPANFTGSLPGDVLEYIDLATSYLDAEASFAQNELVATQLGFRFNFTFRDDDDFKMVNEAKKALGDAVFSERDLEKLKNLTLAIALLRAYKRDLKAVVASIEDAAVALVILLENKRHHGATRALLLAEIVRELTRTYRQIRKDFGMPDGFGLEPAIFQVAVDFGLGKSVASIERIIDANIKRFNVSFTSIADASMRAQFIADLLSVRDFCNKNHREVEAALKLPTFEMAFQRIWMAYEKEKALWTFYQARLDSFFN